MMVTGATNSHERLTAMTAKEMQDLIGRTGSFYVKGMGISVKVVDVRTRYGRVDYLVTPVAGTGETWMTEDSVTLAVVKPAAPITIR
jgi:hypothetical protein